MSIAEKLVTIAENQQVIYEAGQKSEYDRFWDEFQNYGNPKQYSNTFSYNAWNDKTYNPKYTFKVLSCNNMFMYNTLITDTKVPIDFRGNQGQIFYLFEGCIKLVTIRTLILDVTNQSFSRYFVNCKALENITFEGEIKRNIDFQYSPKLSKESIENVLGHLSATETTRTLTLSQTAVDNAFTADEWNALIADKTNWTISLV